MNLNEFITSFIDISLSFFSFFFNCGLECSLLVGRLYFCKYVILFTYSYQLAAAAAYLSVSFYLQDIVVTKSQISHLILQQQSETDIIITSAREE